MAAWVVSDIGDSEEKFLFSSLYPLVFKKDVEHINYNVYVCLIRQELYISVSFSWKYWK